VLKEHSVLEFRLLGPVEVTDDNEPLPLGAPRQRAVLALLLLHAGEVVSSERIVDELWGEQPPRTATSSLQNTVSQLRKLLGPDVLVTKAAGYQLDVAAEQTDVGRFERLLAEARAGDHSAERRAALLQEALGLWRGSPLVDFTFERFAEAEIRRLEELRLVALEERIEADVERGRHAAVVAELEALVREHPLRERLRAHQMLALYRSGRQAEALRAYHDARRELVEELGIEPSPALQQLHASILRQETSLQPVGMPPTTDDHLAEVARLLLAGRVVPVFGPGAGFASDVAAHLAEEFDCPSEHRGDLTRVSQYVVATQGIGPLYDELHSLFVTETEPGSTQRFFAGIAPRLRERGVGNQLLVTTSYGSALERAFEEAGEEFDLVSYVASGRDRGRFVHCDPDGSQAVIDLPNTYDALSLSQRTVILKIHGGVDPSPGRARESFVVSEDDYIAYLAQAELASVIPVTLAVKLRRSHFLFLGYPLASWHLRVFLHRVFGDERIGYRSWAVQPAPAPIQRSLWQARGVDVFDVPLEEYVGALETWAGESAKAGAAS
jgi:DNA-binding SARP family transcriptional activator